MKGEVGGGNFEIWKENPGMSLIYAHMDMRHRRLKSEELKTEKKE